MSESTLAAMLAELSLSKQSADTLSALPPESQQKLSDLVLAAVVKKDERINGAVNNALSVVPLPLRGTVKKMLFS